MGLLGQDSDAWFHSRVGGALDEKKINDLVEKRSAARSGKNFAEADRIRTLLEEAGVSLEDDGEGTYWKRSV
jgi:cysteinyl-tRNA synthetase